MNDDLNIFTDDATQIYYQEQITLTGARQMYLRDLQSMGMISNPKFNQLFKANLTACQIHAYLPFLQKGMPLDTFIHDYPEYFI